MIKQIGIEKLRDNLRSVLKEMQAGTQFILTGYKHPIGRLSHLTVEEKQSLEKELLTIPSYQEK